MKRILVTGGTGFLGSFLLRELLKQPQVKIRAIKRNTSSTALVKDIADQIEWVESDLLDADGIFEACSGIDEIYHSAAMISYHPKLQKEMEQVNIKGTAILVDMALAQKVKRILHVSSISALGKVVGTSQVDESAKWVETKYTNHYGRTKQMAEMEIWRGVAEGLSANMINPSIIVGPGDWVNGPSRIFKRVHGGQKFYPLGATGFVDVRDVASIAVLVMNGQFENERIICNGANWPFLRFFTEIAAALKVKPPSIKATPLIAGLAWRAEMMKARITGSNPLLTKETANSAMSVFQFDNSKSRKLLDYNYRDLSETIRWTANVFLDN